MLCRRQPLVVDPQGHITEDDYSDILAQFESVRGPNFENGPAMYIISPNDRQGETDEDELLAMPTNTSTGKGSNIKSVNVRWSPAFTQMNPEWVTVSRAAALAKRSHEYLMKCLVCAEVNSDSQDWFALFQETTTSLKSYSALLKVDPDFVVDSASSSTGSDAGLHSSKDSNGALESAYTRSMRSLYLGPKVLRRRKYRNLSNGDESGVLVGENRFRFYLGVGKLSSSIRFFLIWLSIIGTRSNPWYAR